MQLTPAATTCFLVYFFALVLALFPLFGGPASFTSTADRFPCLCTALESSTYLRTDFAASVFGLLFTLISSLSQDLVVLLEQRFPSFMHQSYVVLFL